MQIMPDLWLDATQPLVQVETTVALLRVWQAARPQQVKIDIVTWEESPLVIMTTRN